MSANSWRIAETIRLDVMGMCKEVEKVKYVCP